jgi:hypothetical protein
MATYHLYPQEMLRKFEFFPIKCRIQRAAEVFREIREELLAPVGMNYPDANSGNKELPPIKSKVYRLPQLALYSWESYLNCMMTLDSNAANFSVLGVRERES